MSVIPLQSAAEYTMRINLDGIACAIRIYWCEFSDAIKPDMETSGVWCMDISNDQFTINGTKIVGGVELMWPYSIPAETFGGFFLYDMTGENLDPDFEGMGGRWQLDYIPKGEITDFREALNLETV